MRSRAGFAIASAAILLVSCATRLPAPEHYDVLAPLDPSALVFVEAKGSDVALLAQGLEASVRLGNAGEATAAGGQNSALTQEKAGNQREKILTLARSLEGLARRGRRFGFALLPAFEAKASTEAAGKAEGGPLALPASPPSFDIPPFEAAIAGDFDAFGLWLNFVTTGGWKKEGDEWRNEGLDLAVALPKRGLLVAAKNDARRLAARAVEALPSALPERHANLINEGILAWIPAPLGLIPPRQDSGALSLGGAGLPPFGILLLAKTDAIASARSREAWANEGDPSLDIEILVILPEAGKARLFLPAIRLGWYFLGGRLPFEGEASFTAEGDAVRIQGLRLRLSRLVALVLEKAPAP